MSKLSCLECSHVVVCEHYKSIAALAQGFWGSGKTKQAGTVGALMRAAGSFLADYCRYYKRFKPERVEGKGKVMRGCE